jgi:hypothetical protein
MERRSLIKQLGLGGFAWQLRGAGRTARPRPREILARHRNLFTGDSCVYFYNPELWHPEGTPYTAKAIHRYVDLLADNGVDTFLSNPNANVQWYPSKKHETVIDGYRRGDREFFRGHAIGLGVKPDKMDAHLDHMVRFFNLYLDLVEAGVDWLAETVAACRRRGVSPWVSVRMNDLHGAENPEGSHFNCRLFKKKEFRLSGRLPDPRDGVNTHWAGLNYEKREVRDYMLSCIREYVEDYGFEGMELDWLRDPHAIEPPASPAQTALMTSFFADVRALTESRAKRNGKPYPLGLRIPANLGYLKSRGIDVKALVDRGIVDFLGFSNHWQTTWDIPYDRLRAELGPDVVFYGVVENAPNWIRGAAPAMDKLKAASATSPYENIGIRYMAGNPAMVRANAAGKLAAGVHGIEQFNFFCTDQPRIPGLRADYTVLRGIHDLQALRGADKHYCLATPSGGSSMAWETPEQLPAVIDSRNRREFQLTMCAEPPRRKLTVQVVVEQDGAPPRLGVSVNGAWPTFDCVETKEQLFPTGPFTHHTDKHVAYNFTCDAAVIRDGWNSVVVLNNTKQPPRAVKVVSLELGTRA